MTTILQLILVAGIAAILAAPVIARIGRRRFDPFEPIILFVLAYGVMFVARPASMIAHHHLAYDGPRTSTDVSATFSEMLALALLGAIAFVAGYETALGRRLAMLWRGLGDVTARRVVIAAVVIGAAGTASFAAFLVASSGLSGMLLIFRGRSTQLANDVAGNSFYLWYSFYFLVPATFLLLAIGLERRRRAPLVAAFLLGLLFLLRTVPVGARIAILPLLGGGFVLHYVRRATRPSLMSLMAVALTALLVSSFLSDLRGRTTRNETVAQTIVRSTRPSRIAAPFFSGPDSEMAPVLAAALSVIPKRLPYTFGRTIFGDLVSRPIPRALWSDKPMLPRQKLISFIWPVERQKGGINPEFSVLLYFFWDFGVVGVLVGMFLYGILGRALFEYFLKYRHLLAVQLVYSLALWFIVIGLRNSPVDTFVQAMFEVFPAWFALRISRMQNLARVIAVTSR